jgi:hypothetical protein
MKLLALFFIFSNIGTAYNPADCNCRKAKKNETTEISSTRLDLDEQRVKKLKGQVLLHGAPLESVLVEIFTHPGLAKLPLDAPEREREQKRIAACFTDEDGNFCFKGIPAGKYEFRVSKRAIEFAVGVIIINPQERDDNNIVVRLSPAV